MRPSVYFAAAIVLALCSLSITPGFAQRVSERYGITYETYLVGYHTLPPFPLANGSENGFGLGGVSRHCYTGAFDAAKCVEGLARVRDLGDIFVTRYAQSVANGPNRANDLRATVGTPFRPAVDALLEATPPRPPLSGLLNALRSAGSQSEADTLMAEVRGRILEFPGPFEVADLQYATINFVSDNPYAAAAAAQTLPTLGYIDRVYRGEADWDGLRNPVQTWAEEDRLDDEVRLACLGTGRNGLLATTPATAPRCEAALSRYSARLVQLAIAGQMTEEEVRFRLSAIAIRVQDRSIQRLFDDLLPDTGAVTVFGRPTQSNSPSNDPSSIGGFEPFMPPPSASAS